MYESTRKADGKTGHVLFARASGCRHSTTA